MASSIVYILFGMLAFAVIVGIVIIIRNAIKIAATYKYFKNKLKAKKILAPTINSGKTRQIENNEILTKEIFS